jgi:hypothetical protein
MKIAEIQEIKPMNDPSEHWSLAVFTDLELAERTQKPPSEELIERLNHLVSKPPLCWTIKYKDHLPRL